MNANVRLTETEQKALAELRANRDEGNEYVLANGQKFVQVYLDNCSLPEVTRRGWAAVLGSLAKKGFYRPQGDQCFGDVLCE